MDVIPNRRLTLTQRQEIPFLDRFITKREMLIKKVVHRSPIDLVVIVGKPGVKYSAESARNTHHLIDMLKIGKTSGLQIDCPIISCSEP